MHSIYYLGLSGEHRCPLGYLFGLLLCGCLRQVFTVCVVLESRDQLLMEVISLANGNSFPSRSENR